MIWVPSRVPIRAPSQVTQHYTHSLKSGTLAGHRSFNQITIVRILFSISHISLSHSHKSMSCPVSHSMHLEQHFNLVHLSLFIMSCSYPPLTRPSMFHSSFVYTGSHSSSSRCPKDMSIPSLPKSDDLIQALCNREPLTKPYRLRYPEIRPKPTTPCICIFSPTQNPIPKAHFTQRIGPYR